MSDDFIATAKLQELLAEQGVAVSRRTLTKWVNEGRISAAGVLPNGRFLFDRRKVLEQIIRPLPSVHPEQDEVEPTLPLFDEGGDS